MDKYEGDVVEHVVDAEDDAERRSHAEHRDKSLRLPEIVQIRDPVTEILHVQRVDQQTDPVVHVPASVAPG